MRFYLATPQKPSLGKHTVVITYIPVPEMSREFFRGYAFMYLPQCSTWMDWCGGGPLDNGAVR